MRKNFFKKKLASSLALAMVVTSLAVPSTASAATTTKVVKQGGGKAPAVIYVGDKVDYGLSKTVKGNKYTWTISNSKIATINKSGVVTPKAPGKVTIKCTARNSKGKWLASFSHKITVKLRVTSVDIGADDFSLTIGEEKDLNAVKTPANSTDVLKYVSDNTSVATVNAKTGVVKAVGAGEATITVLSKATSSSADSSKYNRKDTVKVTVLDGIQAIKQTTVNKLELTFATDQHEKLTKDNITITDADGIKQYIKDISFSADGKVATITLYADLVDKVTYKVAYDNKEKTFVASVGEVANISLSGKTVQYDKPTVLDVKLLDANGVDVTKTDALQSRVTIEMDASKGYAVWDSTNNKWMITIYSYPQSVTVKAIYHTYDYTDTTEKTYESTAVINSVKEIPNEAKEIAYTFAKGSPDWTKTNTTVPADADGYQLFIKAKDSDTDAELTEKDFTFESSDTSVLTLFQSDDGVYVTPVKTGSALIKATYGKTVKMIQVNIGAASKVTNVTANTTKVDLSDAMLDDTVTVTFTAKDQYGNEVDYSNEAMNVEISGSDKSGGVIDHYTPVKNKVTFYLKGELNRTVTNTYKVTYFGRTFNISVNATKVTDKEVKKLKIEKNVGTVDIVVDKNTDASKTVELKVYGLNKAGQKVEAISGASVVLKIGSDKKAELTTGSNGVATFEALELKDNVATKAAVGTYTASVSYGKYTTVQTSFVVKDSQIAPTLVWDKKVLDRYDTLGNAIAKAAKITSKYGDGEIVAVEAKYGGKDADVNTVLSYNGSITIKSVTIREEVNGIAFNTKIDTKSAGLNVKEN